MYTLLLTSILRANIVFNNQLRTLFKCISEYRIRIRGFIEKNYDKFGEASMTKNDLLSRISIDPNICFGKPCIKGHRIWVTLILDLLASGEKIEAILEEYPGLEQEDILACIAYAAEMTRDSYVEIPLGLQKESKK